MQLAVPYQRTPWSAVVALIATDASKIIKAAPGAGKKLVLCQWSFRSTTSAAQAQTLGDGTINVDVLPASIAVGTMHIGPNLEMGVQLTANTALSVVPAAAGPAGIWIAEGYIDNA